MARRKKQQNLILAEGIITLAIVIVYGIIGLLKGLYAMFSTLVKELYLIYKNRREHEQYLEANAIAEAEELRIEREIQAQYDNAINRLRKLLDYTENKLYYSVEKTEFPSEGRIREYVNFFTYDRETVAVENANALVNEVLHNVLGVYKGKSQKLQDTIVLDNYACDMKDISRNLADKLGLEEVRMVVS